MILPSKKRGLKPKAGEIKMWKWSLEARLFAAAAKGRSRRLASLCKKADINARRSDGYTAIGLAALKNHVDIVDMLLNAGVEVNSIAQIKDEKTCREAKLTALFVAVANGCTATVQHLINAGADVNVSDAYGETPIIYATKKHYFSIVKILVIAGADVNAIDWDNLSVLYHTVVSGCTTMAKLIATSGANPDTSSGLAGIEMEGDMLLHGSKGKSGLTPLIAAIEMNNIDMVEILLEAGATPTFQHPEVGPIPISRALKLAMDHKLNPEILRLLKLHCSADDPKAPCPCGSGKRYENCHGIKDPLQ